MGIKTSFRDLCSKLARNLKKKGKKVLFEVFKRPFDLTNDSEECEREGKRW